MPGLFFVSCPARGAGAPIQSAWSDHIKLSSLVRLTGQAKILIFHALDEARKIDGVN
jgi:hypothetical protein